MDTATAPTAATSPTLDRLLDAELDISPSFLGHYSNHLAMTLVALHQMGAPTERLEETFEAHLRGESEPRDDRPALDERIREVDRLGIKATVRARIPDLADAPVTALFHPMIRLGYAIDAGHRGQVAAALLDWERRKDDLPLAPGVPGDRGLARVAHVLADAADGRWSGTFDLDEVARRPAVHEALDGLTDRVTADDISSFALSAHAASGSFVTLHMVTGARAVRTVAQVLEAPAADDLLRHTAVAMTVALAAVGAPRPLGDGALDVRRSAALPARTEVAASAIASADPHVVKLTNVALVEEARTGDLLYRDLAARAVGLAS